MSDSILQTVGLVAALLIFWYSESAINLMTPEYRLLERAAIWLLAVGAVPLIIHIAQGLVPSLAHDIILMGTVLLLECRRRSAKAAGEEIRGR